jgi:hypothetical protein
MTDVWKYIRIEEVGLSKSGKTRVYRVWNFHHNLDCGAIKWHGGFRKYCFFPSDGFLFDGDCLRLIANALDLENDLHRKGVHYTKD